MGLTTWHLELRGWYILVPGRIPGTWWLLTAGVRSGLLCGHNVAWKQRRGYCLVVIICSSATKKSQPPMALHWSAWPKEHFCHLGLSCWHAVDPIHQSLLSGRGAL